MVCESDSGSYRKTADWYCIVPKSKNQKKILGIYYNNNGFINVATKTMPPSPLKIEPNTRGGKSEGATKHENLGMLILKNCEYSEHPNTR